MPTIPPTCIGHGPLVLRTAATVCFISISGLAWCAEPEQQLQEIVVEGSRNSQLGVATAASAGLVTQKQLEARTVYRPGELL